MSDSKTPLVFISYSHDSEAHKTFVCSIADQLRKDGLDCQIDQYINGFPPEGWQRWMETQVEDADFVLLVCTEKYLQRYRGQDPDGGRGVNFEGVVISQTLYDAYYRNTKFIPVIPQGGGLEYVPLPLKGYSTYTLPTDYTALYRVLTGQHATPALEIGELVALSEAERTPMKDKTSGADTSGAQGVSNTNESAQVTAGKGMSETMKAAYIGAGAALLAAIITGLFALLNPSDNTVTGKCGSVITGSVGGSVSVNCDEGETN
ncbi:SEFIR domain-containing protein [Leucothrix pacifica]|nr:toll/interleukin-1 receptor domain-containing protein [Leucothrix pacifica]